MSARGEIELLTEILAADDDRDSGAGINCPAPTVLWALVEEVPTEQSPLITYLREHVAHCTRCADLAKRFRGFAKLSQTADAKDADPANTAWAAAAPRLNRRIGEMLSYRAVASKPQKEPAPLRRRSWLPSFQLNRLNVAWAAAGFSLVAIATAVSVTYSSRQAPDAGVVQSEMAQAPTATADSPTTGPTAHPAQPNDAPGDRSEDGAASPLKPASTATGIESRREGDSPASAFSAVSSTKFLSNAVLWTFSAGTRARVAIVFVQHDPGGGYYVQGELSPLTPAAEQGAQLASFSAQVAAQAEQVRISIRSFTLNGKQFELQGGVSADVTVSWPGVTGEPVAGQTFEVRIVSGALLHGEASSK
jgi:hypothetical protein